MNASRLALAVTIGVVGWAQSPPLKAGPELQGKASQVVERFGHSLLTMEPNRGQAPAGFDFVANGLSHRFLISAQTAELNWFDPRTKNVERVRLAFVGANASAAAEALDPAAFTSSLFTKQDPGHRLIGMPNFARVRYRQAWPGIDLLYYGNRRNLEYDLVLAPGADPKSIRIRLDSAARLSLTPDGDLLIPTRSGSLTHHKPVAYQISDNGRKPIPARYALVGRNEVRIRLGKYDRSRELVIDPTLTLSMEAVNQPANSVAVDGGGNIYLAGSNNVGGAGACPGCLIYIFKTDPNGGPTSLDQFLGESISLAVTSAGVAYVTGSTSSSFFQTTSTAFQTTIADSSSDAFFIKYVPGTNFLSYSTYFGGLGNDRGFAAAFDNSGFGYITGQTVGGSGFTTTVGPAFGGGGTDAFVAKFNPSASGSASRVYSTYVGGNGADSGNGIAVDSNGNAYVGGSTASTSATFHPLSGTGYNTTKSTSSVDGYIVVLNSAGGAATYLTFLPLAPINGIAVDSSLAAYVTGAVDGTTNALATTASGYQITNGGNGCATFGVATCTDAFLSKYDTTVSGAGSLRYSTYLGGNLSDAGLAVAVDANGNAHVAGRTNSSNFPVAQPLSGLGSYKGGAIINVTALATQFDGFVAKIDTLASGVPSLTYSTYLGGSDTDQVAAISASTCTATVGGSTSSTDFPTVPTANATPPQGFLAKIQDTLPSFSITKTHSGSFFQGEQNATYTITVTNTGCGTTSGQVTVTDALPAGLTLVGLAGSGWSCSTNTCNRSDALAAGVAYPSITATVNVAINASSPQVNQVTVSGGGAASITVTDSTTVQPAGSGLSITKTHVGNFTQGQTNATYTVTVTNSPSAGSTSGTVTVTDTVSSGLTLVSMTGTGWTCSGNSCNRIDALAPGASYPSITVKVNVAFNASSPQVNAVTVSGGGSPNANASDSTTINTNTPTLNVNRTVLNFGYNGSSLITSSQQVTVSFSNGFGIPWVATSNRSNITVTNGGGTGSGTFTVTATNGPSGTITVSAPGASGTPKIITVNVTSVAIANPFGSFDTPANNTGGVVGAVAVTGWALDNIEIATVGIWREKAGNETGAGLVFIANAGFVADARPDVQGTFPDKPFQYRAGWGYQLLTNFLPVASGPPGNGSYKLHVILTNTAGLSVEIGIHTITVDNAHATKPFGTLDTPDQGGTVSGTQFVNFGWALTPQPACIPTDGSTITLTVDSVPLGHPVYNNARSDIQAAFPGYCNTNGAVGYFILDTTTLTNGVHTIGWLVYDNQSHGEGLGSRFFTVLNSGSSAAPEEPSGPLPFEGSVRLRSGFDLHPPDIPLAPQSGAYSVEMEELGRIELVVGSARGHMLIGADEAPLPGGSTLKDGIFYWQPAVGFLGEYQLVFEDAVGNPVHVRIRIVPKRYGG